MNLRIFFDVDTQNDFMNIDGALYVPDAELIKPNLKLLTDFAKANFIPVLGSGDRHFGTPEFKHREGELKRWGGPFHNHCMDGTMGQLHIEETTLEPVYGRVADEISINGNDLGLYISHNLFHNIPEDILNKIIEEDEKLGAFSREELLQMANSRESKTGISPHLLKRALNRINIIFEKRNRPEGIYIEKQSYDVFTNPMAEELLLRGRVKEAVVYGVATDYAVKSAAIGMQKRGIQTFVVIDAANGMAPETTRAALEEMTATGCKIVTTEDILEVRV
jgi:nicotinamidase-related amidase